jgi:hypothetical protein
MDSRAVGLFTIEGDSGGRLVSYGWVVLWFPRQNVMRFVAGPIL